MTVALLNGHITLDHAQAAPMKAKPVDRPLVAAGETSEGWAYFCTRWRAYSRAAKLTGKDLGIQLLECLEPSLRTRTTRGPTPLEDRTEAELLAAIKTIWLSLRIITWWPRSPLPGPSKTEESRTGHSHPASEAWRRCVSSMNHVVTVGTW